MNPQSDPLLQPLRGIAINNPALLNPQELKDIFVARLELLERLLEDLRLSGNGSVQHHLLLGQRGMGKTTLMRRLKDAIEEDPQLREKWMPLAFPEEQYNVSRLSDFYLNCIDALSDTLEQQGNPEIAESLDEVLDSLPEDEEERAHVALNILRECADKLGRSLLLLVDNISLIFDRLGKDQWAIREMLSSEKHFMLIGASAEAM
jgi:Cdc6-like AAA superfamily ATPase